MRTLHPLPSWEMAAVDTLYELGDIAMWRDLLPEHTIRDAKGHAYVSTSRLRRVYRCLQLTAKIMRGRRLTWDDGAPYSYREWMAKLGVSKTSFQYAVAELKERFGDVTAEHLYSVNEQWRWKWREELNGACPLCGCTEERN